MRRFEAPERLAFDFSQGTHVDMSFQPVESGVTKVTVKVSGFSGEGILEQVAGTIEGFSIVLCDLKTLLESGASAHLVRDKAELIVRSMAKAKA